MVNMVRTRFQRQGNTCQFGVLGRYARPDFRARAAVVENSSSNAVSAPEKNDELSVDVEDSAPEFDDAYTVENLSLTQVQELISTVSEDTNIAEVHLKLNELEVRFKRSAGSMPMPAAPAAAVPAAAVSSPATSSADDTAPTEAASVDEPEESLSLVSVLSKKVGIFRRCRYVNTKKVGKTPIVTQGTIVKAGQPMAFIEQLGTFSPIEAPMDGEVVHILPEEGDAVAYDEEIFEMVPSMASSGSRIK